MLKGGLSGIVTSVLIILLVVISAGILWVGVKHVIFSLGDSSDDGSGSSVGIDRATSCINANLQIISCITDVTRGLTSVQVRRGLPEGSLDGVRLVFNTPNGIETFSTTFFPETFETKVYQISDVDVAQSFNVDVAGIIGVSACSLIGSPVVCSNGDVDETAPIINQAACSDNSDSSSANSGNDGDGLIDWPFDPGCSSEDDANEQDPARNNLFALAWTIGPVNEPFISHIYHYQGNGPAGGDLSQVDIARNFLMGQPNGKKAMIILTRDDQSSLLTRNIDDRISFSEEEIQDDGVSGIESTANLIWWDNGADETALFVEELMRLYKNQGSGEEGELDILLTDIESGFSNWQIDSQINLSNQEARWRAIGADSGYEAIRASMGFPEYLVNVEMQNGQYLVDNVDNRVGYAYRIWNMVTEIHRRDYFNISFLNTSQNLFPNIKYASYGSANNWDTIVAGSGDVPLEDLNGNGIATISAPGLNPQDDIHIGNRQSPNLYGWLGQITLAGNGPDGINYPSTSFNSFRYSVNQMRASVLNDEDKVIPWIARKSWEGGTNEECDLGGPLVAMANTDYWQESVLHSALAGADDFIFWAPSSICNGGAMITPEADLLRIDEDRDMLSNTLAEFNLIAGFSDRQSLLDNDRTGDAYGAGKSWKELAHWGNDYVLTGMASGGRKVWRFSPLDSAGYSVDGNYSEGVRFSRVDRTITFSEGIIWNPQNPVSTKGYWIVQPLNGIVNITTCSLSFGCSEVIG
ncbi:MAG: hypothetical protein AABW79_00505 [Nanoarchaeota archaeon]